MVKTRHKETRKKYHHEVSSSEDSDDSNGNDTSTHKSPRVNSHNSCVQSSTAPAYRDDEKVSSPDEEEISRNLKVLQWESGNSNSDKDGIDDVGDDFKELAQELDEEEELGEPVRQTLANILEASLQNPQSYEKMKDKIKIYAKPENCGSVAVKKCNKEFWRVPLTSRDKTKDLCFQTAILKGTIAINQVTSDLVKLKNNRDLTAKDIRKLIILVIKT